MSIAQNFPNIAPSLDLSFALTKKLDPRITYARASSATYYGTETVKAEENLVLYSQEFDNASWTKKRTTVTANSTTAPDGTTTADTLIANGDSGTHSRGSSQSASSVTKTVSIFAKAGTNDFLQIFLDADTAPWANFDLSDGTVGTTGSNQTASVVDFGDGWYRCVLTTNSATATNVQFNIVSSATASRAEQTTLTTTVFLWGAQLEQRSAITAYTPTTDQPITNYIPVLQTAPSNVARFDHDPLTFESLGLLVEEQRTNLLTYSEDFSDSDWAKANSSITSNTIVAPDGTLTMDKLVENTATGIHRLVQSPSIVSGNTYTLSAYFKAGERTKAALTLGGSNFNFLIATFDLVAGTVLSGTGTITPVGNGVYRCSISSVAVNTGGGSTTIEAVDDSGNRSYTGDGYSGIYIWGAQLESGQFSTSYVKTEASQVTRSADSASMTGTNFSSWYRQDEGTFYGETTFIAGDVRQVFQATLSATINSNDMGINSTSASLNPRFRINVNSINQAEPNVILDANTPFKVAGAYKVNDVNIGVNGLLGTLATNATLPVVDQLFIGQRANGSRYLNTTIRKLSYYPQRLSDVQLQGLTS